MSDRFWDLVREFYARGDEHVVALAIHFEVPISTVSRWACGESVPHQNIQRQVRKWIEERT